MKETIVLCPFGKKETKDIFQQKRMCVICHLTVGVLFRHWCVISSRLSDIRPIHKKDITFVMTDCRCSLGHFNVIKMCHLL